MQFHVGLKNENIFEEKRLCVQFPLSLNKIIQPKIFYYAVAMQFTPNKTPTSCIMHWKNAVPLR